ncbi:hypothetical protein [Neokomagataea thailandica]|uniref:Glycosyltransferase RgtA/B/C/D-like domain-containing protein n=1 Tax=Neokomagataea tanensis NBRC 106556 TaxID=1223519 RepID=A0ABQ0QKA2_9PROT|nr:MULTISPECIES: hypothetical protein [Neokomagataea]GBR47836.1 hypothetical protein AA106556_1594 [Neokomagataea tanensis NBRC 106556]
MSSRLKVLIAISSIILALLYLALATHISSLWPKTSDQAGYFEAGLAVLHGNWRLHGWMLTASNFWTSDIALSALLGGIWHLLGHPAQSPVLLFVQPAILWTGLVLSAFYITLKHLPSLSQRLGALVLLLPCLAFPLMRSPMAYFITLSAIHVGTVIYGLWALYWADNALKTQQKRPLYLSALMICLGTMGDPLMDYTATGAILGYAVLWPQTASRQKFYLILNTIIAATCGKILIALNTVKGGFQTESAESRFTAWESLGHNISTTLHDLLLVFGADPSGRLITASTPELLRLGLVLLGILALGSAARQWWHTRTTNFSLLLTVFAGLNLCALMFSNRIELDGNPIATARYLFPAWAALSCLIALHWAQSRYAIWLALLVLYTTLQADRHDLPHNSTGILSAEAGAVYQSLNQNGPYIGIGSWWSSLNIQAASLQHIRVMPGMRDAQGNVHPFFHIQPSFDWSELSGKRFFILLPSPEETFSKADILHSFGEPSEIRKLSHYDILIYPNTHLLPKPH